MLKDILRLKFIDDIYNWMKLKRYAIHYNNVSINGKIYCVSEKKGNIFIGNGCKINSSLKSNPIGGSCKTILYTRGNGKIEIGENTGISNAAIFSSNSIKIGNNVLLGGGTKIYDTDFHGVNYLNRYTSEEKVATSPVIIEDYVFVGAHTIILKGVHIGKGAVIGAGSVVTKNIPENEIWAGNPAKFIRKV